MAVAIHCRDEPASETRAGVLILVLSVRVAPFPKLRGISLVFACPRQCSTLARASALSLCPPSDPCAWG